MTPAVHRPGSFLRRRRAATTCPHLDTTIMAFSAGAHYFHLNHVSTPLPYGVTVAAVSSSASLIALSGAERCDLHDHCYGSDDRHPAGHQGCGVQEARRYLRRNGKRPTRPWLATRYSLSTYFIAKRDAPGRLFLLAKILRNFSAKGLRSAARIILSQATEFHIGCLRGIFPPHTCRSEK